MRVFLGFKVEEEIKERVLELISELKRSGGVIKWVERENLHITLKFFGEIDKKELENIKAVCRKVIPSHKRFEISFKGTGMFPERNRIPRVLWIGSKRNPLLYELYSELVSSFSKLGFPGERRDFVVHLTIGRVKRPDGFSGVKKVMEKKKELEFGRMVVDRISLFKSTLTPKGPIYKVLEEYKLK